MTHRPETLIPTLAAVPGVTSSRYRTREIVIEYHRNGGDHQFKLKRTRKRCQ